ncbi:SCAN domain-containing protein 3-like [Schistocerca cancellata]|uniref:SCAN domain-containing protein 3-like n=1 Tax=Schistocerca cancellata TaxID=274614 RepID=UPI002118C800|nr:SCAN domain-containing protein 3-like [Schistocerca cancellata]
MSGVPSRTVTNRKICEEKKFSKKYGKKSFALDTIVGLKRYNLIFYYTSKHNSFTVAFPLNSNERKEKIAHLKSTIHHQQNIILAAVVQSEAVTRASYQVCNTLVKNMKAFTDAELMKQCMMSVCETLFQNFSNKSTCVRCIEDIPKYLFEAVINNVKLLKSFSITCDSRTDLASMAQFSLFVCYCTNDGVIKEDHLAIITMKGRTKGLCTDDYPSMTDVNKGLIALIKKEWNLPNLLSIHCLLHQESLACQISNSKLKNVMQTVISIINFICARELNRRKFKELLQELGKNYPELDNDGWVILTAFLTNITQKFNTVIFELQGPNKIIGQMTNKIFAFEAKLQLYINELKVKDLLVENPWHVGHDDLKLFCQFGFLKTNLPNEIIELQYDTQLKALFIEHCETQQYTEFWKCVPNNYKNLRECAQFILTPFPSTYLCETSFSKMKYLKNKYRTRSTDPKFVFGSGSELLLIPFLPFILHILLPIYMNIVRLCKSSFYAVFNTCKHAVKVCEYHMSSLTHATTIIPVDLNTRLL